MTPIEDLPELERLGSARRAALGMAATTATMLFIGLPALWIVGNVVPDSDAWDGKSFIVYGTLVLVFAAFVGVPAVAFSAGRLMDRRSGDTGVRASMVRFGVTGGLLGVIPAALIASDVTVGVIAFVFYMVLFALAGAVGHLGFVTALASRRWRITIWALFAIAMMPAVLIVVALFVSSGG